MILGIGIDIASIQEFERLKNESNFIRAHFCDAEVLYATSQISGNAAQHLAAAYAAKEAAVKALDQARGDKFSPLKSPRYPDIELIHDDMGRPVLKLGGEFEKIGRSLGVKKIFLSISHDGGNAVAFVLLEA